MGGRRRGRRSARQLAVVVADPPAAGVRSPTSTSGDAHGAVLRSAAGCRVTPGAPRAGRRRSRAVARPVVGRPGVASCSTAAGRGSPGRRGWTPALDVALAHPDAVVVTDDGDRFGAAGWRLGVAGGGATAAALDGGESAVPPPLVPSSTIATTGRAWRRRSSPPRRAAEADSPVASTRTTPGSRPLPSALDRSVQGERRRDSSRGRERSSGQRLELGRPRGAPSGRGSPSSSAAAGAGGGRGGRGRRRRHLRSRRGSARSRRRRCSPRAAVTSRCATPGSSSAAVPRTAPRGDRAAPRRRRRRPRARRRTRGVPRRALLAAVVRLAALVDAHRDTVEPSIAQLGEQRRRQSEEVRAVGPALEELRRARADAERQLDEVRERQPRPEIEEAEARTAPREPRSRRCAATSTSSRRSPRPPSSPPLPEGSHAGRGCATSSVSSA